MPIKEIRSGGQSGVDRAALDFAKEAGVPYSGWVPAGGWAEDFPQPPGLLSYYPQLQETPSSDPNVRTEWNVRDSDGTLIVSKTDSLDLSPGTVWTDEVAQQYGRPCRLLRLESPSFDVDLVDFVNSFPNAVRLNIAGPRESESPGIYLSLLTRLRALAPQLLSEPAI